MAGLIKEPMNTVRRKEKSCPLSPRPSGPKPDCREAVPLAPETVRQLFDLTGKRIYDVYGLTENTALATCHPKILEACAVGVPDEYRGETVKAFIVVRPGETLTAEEVIAYARERLALYKVPRQIAFLDALPKSAVGKILRRELRALDAKS